MTQRLSRRRTLMTPVNVPPTLASGTSGTSLSTRRCCSRLFLPQTTWTSNLFCEQEVLIFARLYLMLGNYRDVGCKTVANMIKGKTPEEIRKIFNIENDFTPEEEVCGDYCCTLPIPSLTRSLFIGANQEGERKSFLILVPCFLTRLAGMGRRPLKLFDSFVSGWGRDVTKH